MNLLRKLPLFLFSGLVALCLSLASAQAVGVKPLRTELTIPPGSSESGILKIINSENISVQVRPEIDVYVANDEEGFPVPAELSDDDPRNIANWITFSEEEVSLPANSEKNITFTIAVPEGAEPGGRYASIVYAPVQNESGSGVQIRTRVASLLLVFVEGEQVRSGRVTEFAMSNQAIYSDQPVEFAVRFENTGNVHVQPTGEIRLINNETREQLTQVFRYLDADTGKEIRADAIILNPNGGNVLPGSDRVFPAQWQENLQSGEFTAQLTLSPYQESTLSPKSISFRIEEDLQLEGFEFVENEEGKQFILNVSNNGSIHERLQGSIEIYNEFAYMVSKLELPETLPYVAPETTERIVVPWVQTQIPSGNYTAKLTVSHGVSNTSLLAETQFSSGEEETNPFPFFPILTGVLGVLVVLLMGIVLKKKKSSLS